MFVGKPVPPRTPVRLEPRPRPLKIEKPPSSSQMGALLTSESGACFMRGGAHSDDKSRITKGETESQRSIATVQVSQLVSGKS